MKRAINFHKKTIIFMEIVITIVTKKSQLSVAFFQSIYFFK